MRLPSGVRRLFTLPATRERLLREADEEMRFHIEMWRREFLAMGLTEPDADAAARARFGDAAEFQNYSARRAARKARWQRAADWLVEWGQDVRFAARQFRKAPAFSAIAVSTLALGIGANTAIFSVMHRVLIAPLPYPNGDRIVALKTIGRVGFAGLASIVADNMPADPPQSLIAPWRERARSFDMMAGAQEEFLTIRPNGQQDTVSYGYLTANFLPMLGARPAFGRGFRADDELATHGPRGAMISYRWWQRAYGGRNDVVGKIVQHEAEQFTIVGVMPRDFVLPLVPRQLDAMSNPAPDVWLATSLDSVGMTFGRLRPGVTAEDATRELQAIASTVDVRESRVGVERDSLRVRAMRAQDFLSPREVRTVQILFLAVGALLLIACANVANLMLIRAWTRRREFAVRMGLGAGRARLVRLALTESTMLAVIAGAVGIVIARQGLRVIIALRPLALDSLANVRMEPVVLFWTGAISVLTGILFGAAAAFFVSSRGAGDLLRGETRSVSGTVATRRFRSSLIVFEIALSLALLVGSGLLLRSFAALQDIPLGFDPHDLVSIDLLTPPALGRAGKGAAIRDAVRNELARVPGVTDVALGTLPTAGFKLGDKLLAETSEGEREALGPHYLTTFMSSEYFRTARMALVAGRLPAATAADTASRPGIFDALSEEVVVSQSLARRIAPDGNAVGMRIRQVPTRAVNFPVSQSWSTIVGIVRDVQLPGPRAETQENQLYTLPVSRMPSGSFIVRFDGAPPPDVESVLRHAMQRVHPGIIGRRLRVGDDYVREALAPTRFTLALLGAFALVALVLSAVGLYGTIAYTVSQRTREIGIRVALGAAPRSVVALVMRDAGRLAVVGLITGVIMAALSTRALRGLLFSVSPGDPTTFMVIALGVGCIALAASYLPARRAVRIDPIDALRAD